MRRKKILADIEAAFYCGGDRKLTDLIEREGVLDTLDLLEESEMPLEYQLELWQIYLRIKNR
jgi:hypothetical protein